MSLLGIDVGASGCKSVGFSSIKDGADSMVHLEQSFKPDPLTLRLDDQRFEKYRNAVSI
jgi:hypothetical protein